MPYKIAGIDVHKRMLHVVVSDVEVDGEYDLTRRVLAAAPKHCARWPHGWWSRRPRKWSWNRQRNIGGRCGKCWSATGSRTAKNGKAHARSQEHCIWRRRSRTTVGEAARRISAMPNV